MTARRTNLWVDASSFVGRVAELSLLERRLADGARLVTILGAGGMGKSRLARELCRKLLAAPGDRGIWFVSLAEARSEEDVIGAVGAVLGAPLTGVEVTLDRASQVGLAIAGQGAVVLVLDEMEHVASRAALTIGGWMAAAPEATFIVTSREPLYLDGEMRIALEALTPDDAACLFLARSRAVQVEVTPWAADQRLLPAVLSRLEGIPLAIELAAARTGVLTLFDLERQLAKQLDVLRVERRGGPERHATLRAAIGWSFDLLSEEERAALVRCSVFRRGFDIQAAEAVLGGASPSVLDVVQTLHDKSLLFRHATGGPGASTRFGMYEAVRELAQERAGAELEPAREAHALHYASFVEVCLADTEGPRCADALERLRQEIDNVAAAHQLSLAVDAARAARLALGLFPVLLLQMSSTAAHELLDTTLAAMERAGAPGLVARILIARGRVAYRLGNIGSARSDLERAATLAGQVGDALALGRALVYRSSLEISVGRVSSARALADEGLRGLAKAGDLVGKGLALNMLGVIACHEGDVAEGRRRTEESVEAFRACGNRLEEARALGNLGIMLAGHRDYEAARAHHRQALAMVEAIGDRCHQSDEMRNLGIVSHLEGELDEARHWLEEAASASEALGYRRSAAWSRIALAAVEIESGRLAEAAEHASFAMVTLRELGYLLTLADATAYWGVLEALQDRLVEAERMFSEARALVNAHADDTYLRAVSLLEGVLWLALARHDDLAGRADASRERLRRVQQLLETETARADSATVLVAARVLAHALARRETAGEPRRSLARLEVGRDAVWFRADDGALVDLSKRGALRRLLARLVSSASSGKGEPASVPELFAAGWPGERVSARVAANRVYVAVATLRSMGLRDVIDRRPDGYRLEPSVEILPNFEDRL